MSVHFMILILMEGSSTGFKFEMLIALKRLTAMTASKRLTE